MVKRYLYALSGVIFLLLLIGLAGNDRMRVKSIQVKKSKIPIDIDIKEHHIYLGSDGYFNQMFSEKDKKALIRVFGLKEEEIYTFLQGPRAWRENIPWSGEWCMNGVNGNPFGGFGCGLCCLANIYNTLSPYEVSPWNMCEYAMTVSEYAPTGKAGAIDWEHMEDVLEHCGFECSIQKKPKSYKKFQEEMMQIKSAVVLVSSNNDDTYWQNTPGHYVNIWLYREEDDTIFLAEPGSPENNRSRIPLRYVYDALKTKSRYQYLSVEDYQEQKNQWKANGINENWNSPKE